MTGVAQRSLNVMTVGRGYLETGDITMERPRKRGASLGMSRLAL